jgi:hypothetical protein
MGEPEINGSDFYTLNGQDGKPTYALAEAPGNFTFGNA